MINNLPLSRRHSDIPAIRLPSIEQLRKPKIQRVIPTIRQKFKCAKHGIQILILATRAIFYASWLSPRLLSTSTETQLSLPYFTVDQKKNYKLHSNSHTKCHGCLQTSRFPTPMHFSLICLASAIIMV